MYTYEQFKTFIDNELKQNTNASRAAVADSYRIAKDAEIKAWIDQSIGLLMGINHSFWSRVIDFTVPVESTKIEIPYHVKTAKKIKYNDCWYSVMSPMIDSAKFWWNGGNIIEANNFTLSEGTVLKISGVMRSSQVIDDNSVIDFPPECIRALVLLVLLNAAGRDERKKSVWFSQFQMAVEIFRKYQDRVASVSETTPTVGFGI